MRRFWQWAPVVLWACVIWGFSGSSFPSVQSSRYILPLLRWLLPHASQATLELIHLLIRKSAHVVEYYIFTLLVLRALGVTRGGWKLGTALLAFAMVAAYSGIDEFHQSFVPDRGPSAWDSLLDTSAAALALLTVWVWMKKRKARSRLRAGLETAAR